jgi:hypothetical protein
LPWISGFLQYQPHKSRAVRVTTVRVPLASSQCRKMKESHHVHPFRLTNTFQLNGQICISSKATTISIIHDTMYTDLNRTDPGIRSDYFTAWTEPGVIPRKSKSHIKSLSDPTIESLCYHMWLVNPISAHS